MRRTTRSASAIAAALLVGMAAAGASAVWAAPTPAHHAAASSVTSDSPIKHVVLIYQENHSFDNVLGRLCATNDSTLERAHCDGATTGLTHTRAIRTLTTSPDFIPESSHSTMSQQLAIDGGQMD